MKPLNPRVKISDGGMAHVETSDLVASVLKGKQMTTENRFTELQTLPVGNKLLGCVVAVLLVLMLIGVAERFYEVYEAYQIVNGR